MSLTMPALEQHAHPADGRGTEELRGAGLHHLQRGPVPGEPVHEGHVVDHIRRDQLQAHGDGHPRDRVRR